MYEKGGIILKALITGASSGIGRDMARILGKSGHELILVARNEHSMNELKKELKTNVQVISCDLSVPQNCFDLYDRVKNENIDILINNAGYGIFGKFTETSVYNELNMIDLNIKAVHILTKLFVKDFIAKDKGFILNVSSSAGLLPAGPLLSSYYASKSYVSSLTLAVYEELRKTKCNVVISQLCPGPVDTDFNKRAGGKFTLHSSDSYKVAEYALHQMFRGKTIIVPGPILKAGLLLPRFFSKKLVTKVVHSFQESKSL